MNAEEFIKSHFKGIEKETWYPAIVAIAEGYAKHLLDEKNTSSKSDRFCTCSPNDKNFYNGICKKCGGHK